jgi:hypothetical protein
MKPYQSFWAVSTAAPCEAICADDFVVQSTFLTMMIAVTGVSWAYNVLAITLVASVPA